ncbi:hypothetical protein CSE45_1696 [Citreicella sp. SE45]|nr:hypothetical protein CSE45_1696 [Citreicella sp. SE45]
MREASCDDDRALIQTLTVIAGGLGIVLLYYGTGARRSPSRTITRPSMSSARGWSW